VNDLAFASSRADADAVTAVERHHAELAEALATRAETLISTAARGDTPEAVLARDELVRWCREELVPHAAAEERALYPAARTLATGRLLIDGMIAEHGVITGLVAELAATDDAVRAAAAARALDAVFRSHAEAENDLVLPLLAGDPDISLAALLGGMHDLLDTAEEGAAPPDAAGCSGHACSCGEVDEPGYPELDSRVVPHAIRHATVLGALSSVAPGGGLTLIASHDPVPLLDQIEQRWPRAFTLNYLQRGPHTWRLTFTRETAQP
jgi:uncharacterized protein (DUF2249 family)